MAENTCADCKHFDRSWSNGMGDCNYPLPAWLKPVGCTPLMNATDSGCPVFEPIHEHPHLLTEGD